MFDFIIEHHQVLVEGFLVTLGVSAAALALGAPLGLTLAALRGRKNNLASKLAGVYVSFWRGTPILVQLLLVFYTLPLIGLELSAVVAASVALAFNTAAFQSEIYRAGIEAIPAGEGEAGRMLNLSSLQVLVHIEAPQAIRVMLPALIGEMLALVRNSSVISVIAVTDLTRRAQQIASSTFDPLQAYSVALLLYVLFALLLSVVSNKLRSSLLSSETAT